MDKLPLEIIVYIFQYLTKIEQIRVSAVNKKLRSAFFSYSFWTEDEKCLEVHTSQEKSFTKFLKQIPTVRYLNILFEESFGNRPSSVNLETMFQPLSYLECVSLQLYLCKPGKIYFPRTLKHLSIGIHGTPLEILSEDLLKKLADSCPHLEHFQLKSMDFYGFPLLFFNGLRNGLSYFLKNVKESLQTFILNVGFCGGSVFPFSDCPPNVTTLYIMIGDGHRGEQSPLLSFPNLENLQILFFGSFRYSIDELMSTTLVNCSLINLRFLYLRGLIFSREGSDAMFKKLPNLKILYLEECGDEIDIDILMRFIKSCPSLTVLVWEEYCGHSKEKLFVLEKLRKEMPVEIYLNFPRDSDDSFLSENFISLETFRLYHLIRNIFNADLHLKCNAPIINKVKAFIGI